MSDRVSHIGLEGYGLIRNDLVTFDMSQTKVH